MSQITKPMALDETLQDVVTAIQGITQGGMIVSTGTVGSATQPVYIDGGVPTAMPGALGTANGGTGDTKGRAVGTYIPSKSTANVDMSATGDYARASRVDVIDSGGLPTSNWYLVNTMHGGATGSAYGVQLALEMTGSTDIVAYRRYVSGAWTDWKYLNGITTGTPTNPATGLTLQDSQFEKSGNVVVFRVAYKCTSNVTLTGGFAVCTLPWTPAYVTRVTRIVGDTNDGHTQNMSYGTLKTDKKLYGGPNDSQSTTGNYIEYYGTYLTND